MTTAIRYALGKKDARPGAVRFRLMDYLDKSVIPAIPAGSFGHQKMVADWGMLGNDTVGNCAIADGCHQTMLFCTEGKKPFNINTQVAIDTYSQATGYDPTQTDAQGNNPTDQGTDLPDFAEFRRTTGIADADGNVHKIAAYLSLDQGSVSQLRAAMFLFSAVSIGVQLPDSAQDQFQAGEVWTPVRGSSIEGGHCITGLAADSDNNIGLLTWGAFRWMTAKFYQRYNDETIILLSEEFLYGGVSPEGFNDVQLRADLADLGH